MKQTSFLKLLYLIAIVLITQSVSAQTISEKTVHSPYMNQIGLQLNPYLDESLFRGFMPELVFGIRYAYHVTPYFSAGPEVNGFFPVNLQSGNDLFFSGWVPEPLPGIHFSRRAESGFLLKFYHTILTGTGRRTSGFRN